MVSGVEFPKLPVDSLGFYERASFPGEHVMDSVLWSGAGVYEHRGGSCRAGRHDPDSCHDPHALSAA